MKQNMKLLSIGTATIAAATLLTALPAQAYVGPGAGLSLLSALWAVFVAVGFVLLWPIRKMMRNRKRAQQNSSDSTSHSAHSHQPKA